MITKQNDKYAALFEKASQDLGITEQELYITTLEEYFSNIVELANRDLKYTILPLDEETFDIDANTREIKVPESFKDGCGVKGDQVAEIIYFTIDRYFDATDLNTQNIYIEWKNADGDTGLSEEYVRDLETLPNKIIFGWPLTKEITDTEKTGNVEFAVRFYSVEDSGDGSGNKKVVYSFGTKPQKIAINNTMNFSITDNSIQVLGPQVIKMIKDRFKNSEQTNGNLTAEAPQFLLNLEDSEINKDLDIHTYDEYDNDISSYTLQVIASSSDGGRISYTIQKSPVDKDDFMTLETAEPLETYILTKDVEKVDNKIYYTKEQADGITGYVIYTGELPNPNTTIYERIGMYQVTEAGKYRFIAQNRLGAKYANKTSNTVIFPKPEIPNVQIHEPYYPVILTQDKNDADRYTAELKVELLGKTPKGQLSYQWTQNNNVISENQVYVVDNQEGYYNGTIINTRNNSQINSQSVTYRVTYPAHLDNNVIKTNLPSASYIGDSLKLFLDMSLPRKDLYRVSWYELRNPVESQLPDINNDIHKETIEISNSDGMASYTPSDDGYYYAVISAIYNGNETTEVKYSNVCMVSTKN